MGTSLAKPKLFPYRKGFVVAMLMLVLVILVRLFFEHQSYKVILIANEEELEKTEKYSQIKEKLIGKTFEFISRSSRVVLFGSLFF